MGSHIDDILQIPRPPTFGKKKKTTSIFAHDGEADGESHEDGPRIKPFGVMTRPEIIKEKKELKEKKLNEEREKVVNATRRKLNREARDEASKVQKAQKQAVLDKEKPLRNWILRESIVEESEMSDLSKKPLSLKLLQALARAIGMDIPKDISRALLLRLLLDDGTSHS